MPFGVTTSILPNRALVHLRYSKPQSLVKSWPHLRVRLLATVPSSGPDIQVTGQCNVDEDETIQRKVTLSNSIRLANASVDELRQEFLTYYQTNKHTAVAPSSVFPKIGEGSYFINAGMNQFKSLFLSQKNAASSVQFSRLLRATNSQPCIRLGGRHDDLNDVGYDRQHHTMFEMLGSWSFGDYYKQEACHLMWNFVTRVLGLPKNALYVTYFGGCPKLGLPPDDETRDIWLQLGVIDQKLMPFGMEHNFWRAGQTSGGGLCGPSTELHVDFNALHGNEGLNCARCLINTTNPQVVELCNTVFISHRLKSSAHGLVTREALEPLPKRFVDTGMGLERLASVLQGVTSTYDTDVFAPLLQFIHTKATTSSWTPPPYGGEFIPFCRQAPTGPNVQEEGEESTSATPVRSFSAMFRKLLAPKRANRPYCANRMCAEETGERAHRHSIHALGTDGPDLDRDLLDRWHRDTAYRLMVDHSRALAHALADGLVPGRQGLGLKLRQLIHRASRASVLTGLDPGIPSSSVLGSLVAEVARRDQLASLSSIPALQGPSARQPSQLSYEEMEAVVTKEVLAFLPRLETLEEAFHQCLDENPEATRLSPEQVNRLMNGKYGVPVSWDMLCAQSHWFGLCVPEAVSSPSSSSADLTFASPASSPGRPMSKPTTSTRSSHSTSLAQQLQQAGCASTDDAAKYRCQRTSDSLGSASGYVIPELESCLIGVFVSNGDEKGVRLYQSGNTVRSALHAADETLENLVGLVFDRTNFFSPAGGQDGDQGEISLSNSDQKFQVVEVEHVSHPEDPYCSWVVHWCHPISPVASGSVESMFHFDLPYRLHVDSERRVQLMRHHTGQHLFAWAAEQIVSGHLTETNRSNSSKVLQHQGGSVHPDRFVVNTTLGEPVSTQQPLDQDAVDLVRQIETLCLKVIQQGLVVDRVQADWNSVSQNPKVRRFPWMDYPDTVTAVCIGQPLGMDDKTASSSSAELCAGTHVANTADLVDLVVVSLRSRNQAVKQFTGVVGEVARQVRLRGDRLLIEALDREARASTHPSELSSHIDWLSAELSQQSTLLPYVTRELLQACLLRMRTQRNLGQSKNANVQVALLVERLRQMISVNDCVLHLDCKTPYKPESIAEALDQIHPTHMIIVCCCKQAVCYFPQSQLTKGPVDASSALNVAHRIVHRLNTTDSSVLPPGSVKARPIRSNGIRLESRLQLASLQLTQDNLSWDNAALRSCLERAVRGFFATDRARVVQ